MVGRIYWFYKAVAKRLIEDILRVTLNTPVWGSTGSVRGTIWFSLHFHLKQHVDTCLPPSFQVLGIGGMCPQRWLQSAQARRAYCGTVQAVWLFDMCHLKCRDFILCFRAAHTFTAGINWASSLCRLDTGDWKIIPRDVLPVTVILEVLILPCKSVKWMT